MNEFSDIYLYCVGGFCGKLFVGIYLEGARSKVGFRIFRNVISLAYILCYLKCIYIRIRVLSECEFVGSRIVIEVDLALNDVTAIVRAGVIRVAVANDLDIGESIVVIYLKSYTYNEVIDVINHALCCIEYVYGEIVEAERILTLARLVDIDKIGCVLALRYYEELA